MSFAESLAKARKDREMREKKLFRFQAVLFAFVLLYVFVVYPILLYTSSRTVTFTVQNVWRYCRSAHEDCKWLIGTSAGVFQDTDSALFWKWSSSDYANNLLPGHTYRVTVVGWRIPISSEYPNIVQDLGEVK